MWILDNLSFELFQHGNLRINVLIVTVVVLVSYIGKILKTCLIIIEV